MTISILYTVHNNYLIFRASIESLFSYVQDYDEIVLVDDKSNDAQTIDFLKYLNTLPKIRVISGGGRSKQSFYNKSGRGKGKELSLGQGEAINLGIRNIDNDYILSVDSDILFLPSSKDLLPKLIKTINLDSKIMAVGQLVGKIDGVRIIDNPFPAPAKGNRLVGGYINACAMFCRNSGWKKHGLSYLNNGGWCHRPYASSIFKKGFKVCNFNIFKDAYLIHLGYATLRDTRKQPKKSFGFAKDSQNYGSPLKNGVLMDWYAGYKSIPYTTNQAIKLFKNTYLNLEFNKRHGIIVG